MVDPTSRASSLASASASRFLILRAIVLFLPPQQVDSTSELSAFQAKDILPDSFSRHLGHVASVDSQVNREKSASGTETSGTERGCSKSRCNDGGFSRLISAERRQERPPGMKVPGTRAPDVPRPQPDRRPCRDGRAGSEPPDRSAPPSWRR